MTGPSNQPFLPDWARSRLEQLPTEYAWRYYPMKGEPMSRNGDHSALDRLSIPYRAIHGLLATGAECLARAEGIAKERSLDPAVIAEISASMALASAARAMVIAIHQSRGLTERTNALDMG